jgi:acyl dehydratase
MTGFDPAQHRMVPQQRWFDDFVLGERFVLPSRTMTEAVFLAFQGASGDAHAACPTCWRTASRR